MGLSLLQTFHPWIPTAKTASPVLRNIPIRPSLLKNGLLNKRGMPQPPSFKDQTSVSFEFSKVFISLLIVGRQAEEARKRRAGARKARKETGIARKANELVEVKKLKKTRYNQWGEKIEVRHYFFLDLQKNTTINIEHLYPG